NRPPPYPAPRSRATAPGPPAARPRHGPGGRRGPWLPRTLVRSRARTLRDDRCAPARRDARRCVDHLPTAEGGDPGALDCPARVLAAAAAAPVGGSRRSLAVSDVLCGQ